MTIRILHLEDNPVDAELIHEILAAAGIEAVVDRVVTERDFTAALDRGGYHLVLSDYALPGFDGATGLRLAHAKAPDLPFIFVSGTLGEEAAVDRLREGATDYVLKERLARLAPAVRRALHEATERASLRRAQQAISAHERLLQAVLDSTPAVIYVKDLEGRYVHVNRRYEELFALDRNAVLGRTDFELCPREVAEAYRASELAAQQAGQPLEVEEVVLRPDGPHTFLSLKAPLLDADLRRNGICGVSTDITDRKRAEERLRRSEAQVRALAETVPCGLFIVQGGRRIYANRTLQEITGYTQEELLAQDPLALAHPDDRARIQQATHAGPYEVRWVTRSGDERWIEISEATIDYEGRPATMGAASDVTERRRGEALLQRQKESLAQAEKLAAMGSLLAGVAHELNNPLSVVIGQLDLLRRGLAGKDAERAASIASAASRCARIVRDFLAAARQRPTEKLLFSLPQVVHEALDLVAYHLHLDSVDVAFEAADDVPLVFADPHQIHQVVVNLVTNAHHALRGRPQVRRITLRVYAEDGHAALEVEDNGPGVAPELRERVLEPFFTTKPAGEGTGLGLSLCKAVVAAHQGSLSVEAGASGGALFRIRLPVGMRPPAAPTPLVAEAHAAPGGERRQILVVEDEQALRELLAELLTDQGYAVSIAENGRHALELLEQATFDLIVSDIRMPELDGPGLYREVQRRFPELPPRFLFLSGDSLDPETVRFLEEVPCPRLDKPFSIDQAHDAVMRALRAG